ncbi:MAG TPA: hypothetical protein PKM36_01080 [Propionibacteriaceae bacterium]|nr:hypothetical protein [Propionibacteriaceae bacterium]HPZ48449.1 hypothetical protein [Propionibacteriaceae bacterium]HQE31650.1 hypothetical protein [Propionibacteriaceae bacterium]
MSEPTRPRRPAFTDPARIETLGTGTDPIARIDAAHETAAVLLGTGRAAADPMVTARLVAIVDEVGITTLADLWADRPAQSLPGALWRLYALRQWIRENTPDLAREYAYGVGFADVDHVVAGVDPPGLEEVREVADQILRGAFEGDFAVALERAAAFCRVVVAGRAYATEGLRAAIGAARIRDTATELTECARLWRTGDLA